MQWTDEGVILSVRPHGENGAVLELFTRQHGRHLGLVHGGRSRRQRPVLQTGNHVDATWKARLADNLGHFAIELRKGFAAHVMDDAAALAALTSMAALARLLERLPLEQGQPAKIIPGPHFLGPERQPRATTMYP